MDDVFISYVRDDQKAVDLLAAELRREGLHVWLDREDIRPGEFWEQSLRAAIEGGAYFLACFSEAFERREETYMHEELRVAAGVFQAGDERGIRLIPIILSRCSVPALPLSEGHTLKDLQWIDLAADWNTGIWRLLQTVRPPSSHSRTLDDWFRKLCHLHIKSNLDRAWSMGAFRVREIEDGWRSLLLPSRWSPTLDIMVRLFNKVKERGIPLTERWVEPADKGITIICTISPTASVQNILNSLSPTTSGTGSAYDEFIRHERQVLRNLPNWPDRDLAHWIFAWDGDDLTVDLLYWPNLRLMLLVWGMAIERQRQGKGPGPIEGAYPGSLLTVTEHERLLNDVAREEVRVYQEQRNA